MIEGAVRPLHRVVAGLARGGEIRRGVIHGSQSIGVVSLVAGDARRAGQVVVVVGVAVGALARRNRVGIGQRESRAVVVKARIQPRTRVMALIAALREV